MSIHEKDIDYSMSQTGHSPTANRRQFISTLGGAAIGLLGVGTVSLGVAGQREKLPTFSPPTPETTPVPEPIDVTPKNGKFRLLTERELDTIQRDSIVDISNRLADFSLPDEITIKEKGWRTSDGGYTEVSQGHLSLSGDLFENKTSRAKRQIEIQQAMANLIIVNINHLDPRYKDALAPLGELLEQHENYKSADDDPSTVTEYKRGFLIFNPYRYIEERERNEEDIPRQDERMKNDVAEDFSSVITTIMLSGPIITQVIRDFPTRLIEDPALSIAGLNSFYTDSPQRYLAKDKFNKCIELLKALKKPGNKQESYTRILLENIRDFSEVINAEIPQDE